MSHHLSTAQAILSALTEVQEQFHGAVEAEDHDRAAELADIVAEQTNRMAVQALAHATVALAEEQHTANLIALSTTPVVALQKHGAAIKEGLGL